MSSQESTPIEQSVIKEEEIIKFLLESDSPTLRYMRVRTGGNFGDQDEGRTKFKAYVRIAAKVIAELDAPPSRRIPKKEFALQLRAIASQNGLSGPQLGYAKNTGRSAHPDWQRYKRFLQSQKLNAINPFYDVDSTDPYIFMDDKTHPKGLGD